MNVYGSNAHLISRLRCAGVCFGPGLSAPEVREVEERWQFQFPPDLNAFLTTALPLSPGFPDWRSGDPSLLQSGFMDRVPEGVLFDVEHSDVWLPEWGPRPARMEDAVAFARARLDEAPKLIPVCHLSGTVGLKCMASDPRPDTPVFSIRQSDIVHCGRNLSDFLRWAVSSPRPDDPWPVFSEDYLEVPFWTRLARDNCRPASDWPGTIPLLYPGYAALKATAEAAGLTTAIVRTDGRFAVTFRQAASTRIVVRVAHRQRGWILGNRTFGGAAYRMADFEQTARLCATLFPEVAAGSGEERMSEIIESTFGIKPEGGE